MAQELTDEQLHQAIRILIELALIRNSKDYQHLAVVTAPGTFNVLKDEEAPIKGSGDRPDDDLEDFLLTLRETILGPLASTDSPLWDRHKIQLIEEVVDSHRIAIKLLKQVSNQEAIPESREKSFYDYLDFREAKEGENEQARRKRVEKYHRLMMKRDAQQQNEEDQEGFRKRLWDILQQDIRNALERYRHNTNQDLLEQYPEIVERLMPPENIAFLRGDDLIKECFTRLSRYTGMGETTFGHRRPALRGINLADFIQPVEGKSLDILRYTMKNVLGFSEQQIERAIQAVKVESVEVETVVASDQPSDDEVR